MQSKLPSYRWTVNILMQDARLSLQLSLYLNKRRSNDNDNYPPWRLRMSFSIRICTVHNGGVKHRIAGCPLLPWYDALCCVVAFSDLRWQRQAEALGSRKLLFAMAGNAPGALVIDQRAGAAVSDAAQLLIHRYILKPGQWQGDCNIEYCIFIHMS